jgi:hypothetical protein
MRLLFLRKGKGRRKKVDIATFFLFPSSFEWQSIMQPLQKKIKLERKIPLDPICEMSEHPGL